MKGIWKKNKEEKTKNIVIVVSTDSMELSFINIASSKRKKRKNNTSFENYITAFFKNILWNNAWADILRFLSVHKK